MASPQVQRKVFILASTLVTGGAEKVAGCLAKGLPLRGYEVEMLCLRGEGVMGERLAREGVSLTSELSSGRFDLSSIIRIRRLLSKAGRHALIALDHHDAIFTGAIASRLAGEGLRILSVHSTGLWDRRGTFNWSDRLVLPLYGEYVALSSLHADYLEKDGRLSSGRIRVIHNGVDTDRFRPAEPGEKSRIRSRLSIDESDFVVTIVAALRPEKNHAMFIEAAERLAARDVQYRFLVVGGGSEAEKLLRTGESLRREGRLEFLGEREDVEELLRASDCAVLCSHPVVETFPLTVLEGMATGLPVVSTDVGSIREMITDGRDGIIIGTGDVEALVEAVESLKNGGDRAGRIGAEARKSVTERFSVDRMVDGYASLIAEPLRR